MHVGLWAIIGFLSGSIPFSYWLGKLISNVDIRRYGDGNPGAFNAWRAGSYRIGVPSAILDYSKGLIPVLLARHLSSLTCWWLVPIALSPVLGHAFSPFLHFRGGKAVATTFGIWTALTLWEGPTVFGLSLGLSYLIQSTDAWSVMFSISALFIYLWLRHYNKLILIICIANAVILAWKHRKELPKGIYLRSYLRR